MVSSYSNRSATFDANQKTIITSIFSQLQVVFTKISVNIRRRERIILEQKNTSVSLALQLIVKAQSTLNPNPPDPLLLLLPPDLYAIPFSTV